MILRNITSDALTLSFDGITDLRVRYTDHHGWRVQSAASGSLYDDNGACQTLSAILSEERAFPYCKSLTTERSDSFVRAVAPDGSSVVVSFDEGLLRFYSSSGSCSAVITGLSVENGQTALRGKLFDGDAVYGSGERYDHVNLRGTKTFLYTFDIWDQIFASYLVIPVFGFSRGGGLFMNRYEGMEADFGATLPSEWRISVRNAPVDCYVFAADQIADVLYGYSSLSGFARKPEDWAYRMIVCRYAPDFCTERGIDLAVRKMEEYDLPWQSMILEGFPTYDPANRPLLKKICDKFHKMGKKVLLYTFIGNFHYQDLPDPSYLMHVRGKDGKLHESLPAVRPGVLNPDFGEGVRGYRYVDLTDPEVCDWYFGPNWGTLAKEIGVDGCKIDFCELLPDNDPLILRNGQNAPSGAHHWWPTVYNTKYYDLLSSKEGGGLCFSRGGGIGAQRNPFLWGGDQSRRFDRMRWQVVCMLETGLSGVPFVTFDMAGYQYPEYAHSLYDDEGNHYFAVKQTGGGVERTIPICPIGLESKIFLRGLTFAAFSAGMQTHGKVRRPYDFAEEGDTLTTDIYREYVKLHDLLVPYISHYASIACETGMPIMRHLILRNQNDRNVYDLDDEYTFGDSFLVAPVLDDKEERDVYLPQGMWEDLWTGKTYTVGKEGLTLPSYHASARQIPVFFDASSLSAVSLEARENVLSAFEKIRVLH